MSEKEASRIKGPCGTVGAPTQDSEGPEEHKRWVWSPDPLEIRLLSSDIPVLRLSEITFSLGRIGKPHVNPPSVTCSASLGGYWEPQGWASDGVAIPVFLLSSTGKEVAPVSFFWCGDCPASGKKYGVAGANVDPALFEIIVGAKIALNDDGFSPNTGYFTKC